MLPLVLPTLCRSKLTALQSNIGITKTLGRHLNHLANRLFDYRSLVIGLERYPCRLLQGLLDSGVNVIENSQTYLIFLQRLLLQLLYIFKQLVFFTVLLLIFIRTVRITPEVLQPETSAVASNVF